MSRIQLRPYQQEYIKQTRERFKNGANRIVLVAPT